MIPVKNRAEKRCIDALLSDEAIVGIYGKNNIYMGYAAPNTLASVDCYILVRRIDASDVAPTTTGRGADCLRRVRVQIDVWDTRYSDMVRRAEMVKGALNMVFPSCIDGDTYGVEGRGQKNFNVCSIDAIIYEEAE